MRTQRSVHSGGFGWVNKCQSSHQSEKCTTREEESDFRKEILLDVTVWVFSQSLQGYFWYMKQTRREKGLKNLRKKMEDKREEERRRQEIENERKAKENETQELLLWKVLDHCLISSM